MQRDRPLRSSAAQLEHVATSNFAEHPELRLGDLPQPPGGATGGRELPAVRLLILSRALVPQGPVASGDL